MCQKDLSILSKWLSQQKNIIISIDEPFTYQQVFLKVQFRDYNDCIIIDGKNTIASCFHISKNRIANIHRNKDDNIQLILNGNINISFSAIKSNPNLWTREIMNKNWEAGRMCLYE